ncbi:MAG: hypothetical protein HQL71_09140 [Magnetococcales bacterium]|nr:hypothetical protein [Magnetococcales bacterium]
MSGESCRSCSYFIVEPLELEKAIPGLNILSSAMGSVRGDTGWCKLLDIFQVADNNCPKYFKKPK